MSSKPHFLVYVGVAVAMVIAVGFYFSFRNTKKESTVMTPEETEALNKTKLQTETNPVKNVPDLNPTEKTNPFGIFSSSFVLAEEAPEITFPVAELGNCKDKTECFAFCELPENEKNCLAFAKEHNLLSEEEIRIEEKVQSVGGGPGNCKSKDECEAYCDDVSNIEECLKFAEENDLMKGKDLEEARKVRDVLKSGGKLPGNCKNKNACESYCQDGEHMEECLAFA